jgi:B12-binding domain/radical SAM domain protein of rhizo-twelve system
MRVALVNPPWTFEGSVYFGCREPHLPLEYGYSKALLERAGHDVLLVDAQLDGLSMTAMRAAVAAFEPAMTVITTAPSYLFWRCAPPELRMPQRTAAALRDVAGEIVVVGPHASTTPASTLRKVGAAVAVLGECEEVIARLASTPRDAWGDVDSLALREGDLIRISGGRSAVDLAGLPALRWPDAAVGAHRHHHHRFDRPPVGPGAEVEASRGCPYACTFCAKDNFRTAFRRRPLPAVLDEIDALLRQGVEYVYFVDEIFLPDRALLEALCERELSFGVQMRIDHWSEESLDLLGRAGCVSIEAGIESITPEGRSLLAKRCRMSTDDLTRLLLHAKQRVAFVQANLIDAATDDPAAVARWRAELQARGVWANEPVPMFPYPGSPEYTRRWGDADDRAWERAHEHYLETFRSFSDIQESRPRHLSELERP